MPSSRGGRAPGRGPAGSGGIGCCRIVRGAGYPPWWCPARSWGGARWVGASDVPPDRAIPRIGLFLASKNDSATSESPLCPEVARGDGSPPVFSLVKAKANLFRSRYGAGECCKPVFARKKAADSLPGLPPSRRWLAHRPRLSPPGLADGTGGRLAARVVCASPPAGAPRACPRRLACFCPLAGQPPPSTGVRRHLRASRRRPPAALGYTGARRKGA